MDTNDIGKIKINYVFIVLWLTGWLEITTENKMDHEEDGCTGMADMKNETIKRRMHDDGGEPQLKTKTEGNFLYVL